MIARTASCARAFEAEALRDGRLTGGERASFERHAATCAACAREIAALDALAASLHESAPVIDEVRDRRERVRLLAAFDASLVKPKRRSPRRPVLLAAGVAAALFSAFFFGWQKARISPDLAAAVSVHAQGVAAWSEQNQGGEDRVSLTDGTLRIHVDHARGAAHLVVAVPDGELEDIGTTFVVNVANGHTARIAVEEGRVIARLRAWPARTIRAGETWIPESAAAATVPVPGVAASSSSAASTATAAPSPSTVRAGAASDAAADFRAAMAALTRGDNRQASQMLGNFLQKYPSDAHAEDAAYSRVIALERCGDAAQTGRAAKQYLARYPAGFRHTEVEALAH